jgi:hypothetical protein
LRFRAGTIAQDDPHTSAPFLAADAPRTFLAALVLLALAACDEDPARLADGPRYVWVSQEATVIPADHSNGEITAPGYAYARMALELTYTGPYTWLFTDSTMRDTIGLASPSQLSATTPSGDSIRPGTPGSPALVVALSKRKAGVLAARRAELAARAAGTQTRVGYPACTSLRSLESWMAGSARDDASTTDSLQERGGVRQAQ